MGFIWSLISWVLGKLFGGSQPSAEANAAASAAAATTVAKIDDQVIVDQDKAAAAESASLGASIANPGSLRQPDADSRD